jgi:hypothetical protein
MAHSADRLREWKRRAELADFEGALRLADEIRRTSLDHELRGAAANVQGMCKPVKSGSGPKDRVDRARRSIRRLTTILDEKIGEPI